MQFDTDNQGTWFEYVEGKPKEGRVCLRVCNGEALKKIEKATVKKQVEYKKGQRFEFYEVDEETRAKMIWDYCIPDWENTQDAKGKDIPCTAENKLGLMRKSNAYKALIERFLDKLSAADAKHAEEVEKN